MVKAGKNVETYWNKVKQLIGEDDWTMPEATGNSKPENNAGEALGQASPDTDDAGTRHICEGQSFANCLAIYKSVRDKGCRPFPGEWGTFINQPAVRAYAEADHPILAGLLSAYLQSHFHYDLYIMQAEALGKQRLYRQATSIFAPHRGLIDVRAAYEGMRWAQGKGQRAYAQGFFHDRQMHIVAEAHIPALNSYIATALLEGTAGLFKEDDALRHDQQYWPDCLPALLANDCPVHHVASNETTTDNTCRIALCGVVPVVAAPLDLQAADDGNYYLFGADIEVLSQLPAYDKLPKDEEGNTRSGNGLELGKSHISIAFSNLSSLKDIHRLIQDCGSFDMRHSMVRSHILGLMMIKMSGEIYSDLSDDVATILKNGKNEGREGVLSAQRHLMDIGHHNLAQP